MEAGDIFFGRRIRQNHAIEHATVTVLTARQPHLRLSARSTSPEFCFSAVATPVATVVSARSASLAPRLIEVASDFAP